MISNNIILITGGAGFIGTKLTDILSENNTIIIYDNLRRNFIKNTDLVNNNNVKLIEGDVLNFNLLKSVVEKYNPNIVIHLAAIAGIDTVIKNPVDTMKVNIIGTYNVLEALKGMARKVERFVDFSTSEVFGSYAYKVDEECTTNLAPVGAARWTYSVSKLASEHLTYSYYKKYGLPAVIIRPFNIYGPGQIGEGAVHEFVIRAIKNKEMQIHGDGSQIRSWCYIDDFVQGVLKCLEKQQAIGNTFNIGNPKGTVTICMLAETIKRIANSKSIIKYVPKNYVDVELRIPSIEKAIEILDYKPQYDLNKGLKRTIHWYRGVMCD